MCIRDSTSTPCTVVATAGRTGSSTRRQPRPSRKTDPVLQQEVIPVPLSGPYIDARDEELVLEVLRSGRLSLGPMIDRFEEAFAAKLGVPYAAAVSSGTAGLHLLCISA